MTSETIDRLLAQSAGHFRAAREAGDEYGADMCRAGSAMQSAIEAGARRADLLAHFNEADALRVGELRTGMSGMVRAALRREPAPDWKKKQAREHYDKYRALAEQIGVERLARLLPGKRTPERWRALHAEDQHLNNTPLASWDRKHSACFALARTYAGRRGFANSETVCVLKWVAAYAVAGAEPPPEEWAQLESE